MCLKINLLDICIVNHSSGTYFGDFDCKISSTPTHICDLHKWKWESCGRGKQGVMVAAMQVTKHDPTMHLFVEFYQKYMSKII